MRDFYGVFARKWSVNIRAALSTENESFFHQLMRCILFLPNVRRAAEEFVDPVIIFAAGAHLGRKAPYRLRRSGLRARRISVYEVFSTSRTCWRLLDAEIRLLVCTPGGAHLC